MTNRSSPNVPRKGDKPFSYGVTAIAATIIARFAGDGGTDLHAKPHGVTANAATIIARFAGVAEYRDTKNRTRA